MPPSTAYAPRLAVKANIELLLTALLLAERAADGLIDEHAANSLIDEDATEYREHYGFSALADYVQSVVASSLLLARTLADLLPLDIMEAVIEESRSLTHADALVELDEALTAARRPASWLVHSHDFGPLNPVVSQVWGMVDIAHQAVSVYQNLGKPESLPAS